MIRKIAFALALLLPATASAQEIHIVHCLKGCPTGTPATNDLIVREIYALSSNDNTKMADWVAYHVTRDTVGGPSSRSTKWKREWLLEDDERLEEADYDDANVVLKMDRGHQAPFKAFSGTKFWKSTFVLSNATPQQISLNRGAWRVLEGKVVRVAKGSKTGLFVVTGPLYEKEMPKLPKADESYSIPSGYWKVIADEKGHVSAFILHQDHTKGQSYCTGLTTLVEVESRSGLDLFPQATGWPTGDLNQRLGCPNQ